MLVDSHCHLDFDDFKDDLDGVVGRARAVGVARMVTISTRVRQFDKITAIAERFEDVYCSVGTHPHNADEELDIEASDLIALAAHPKCVAIGEAGLDYFYDNAPRAAQAMGFHRHIEAARVTQLPLVIHTRAADDDTARILREESAKGAFPFILHCFSAGADLARLAIELGGYVSFSGILTFKSAQEIRDVAAFVPMERLLVETDAPYLAPVPHRGKTNEPAFVAHTAQVLADVRGVSLEEIGAATSENFARLFTKVVMPD